jgi:hypothetical protein
MKGKGNWQLQGTIKLSENVSWGTRTTRTTRYGWNWRDDDGPRLAGSNLLAFACSRPDCLDPGDRPPSLLLHQPRIPLVQCYLAKISLLSFYDRRYHNRDLLCFLSLGLVIIVVYGSSPIHKATLFYPLVM